MGKQLVAFDLDGTLALSKSPLPDRMSSLLKELLAKYEVCVISGGRFEQFETQLLSNLHVSPSELQRLHIMPTCGTRYYLHDASTGNWKQQYAEDFTDEQKQKITAALNQGIDHLGYREKQTWGETIEDRGSQITFSALGQNIVGVLGDEGVRKKEEWDQDMVKRTKLRDYVSKLIPEFEVRVGGGTSIDITKPGIDKAYGMEKLMAELEISKDDILFVGDRLEEGGNDYPVKAMGIDCIAIEKWQETALAVEVLICLG